MRFLPVRPLKVRIGFLVTAFVVAPCALAIAVAVLMVSFEDFRIAAHARLIIAAALTVWAVSRLRRAVTALLVLGNCEEAVAELIEVDRSRTRSTRHSLAAEKRRYRFLVGGRHFSLFATVPSARPLFIDDAHTQALVLRSPSGTVLFLGADLSPVQLSAQEERAVRERIEEYRALPEPLRGQAQ
jgi:hypothetical protein